MFTLIVCLGLLASPEDTVDEIISDAVNAGQSKIGVIPVVISRQGDQESTIGTLGPRGKIMANSLYDKMVTSSQSAQYRGRFHVVPERVMRAALASRTVADLSNPRKLQELAKEVGDADGFMIMSIDEDTSKINVQPLSTGNGKSPDDKATVSTSGKALSLDGSVEIIRPSDATLTSKVNFRDAMTITKAAFQGESWELRRWNKDTLENRGIDMDGALPFAIDDASQQEQYAKLKANNAHPFQDTSFPYPISIEVGSSIRQPQMIFGKAVVELNSGEEYSILVHNNTHRDVYIALYIDGVNSIDQQLVEPEKLETKSHWHLQANSGQRKIKGWFAIPRDAQGRPTGPQTFKAFKILDRADSVAAQHGFQDNIGMVTAIFYTVGMEGVPQFRSYGSLGDSRVGTGEGSQGTASLKFSKDVKQRGIMLASWTFYYRTNEQLVALKAGKSNDTVLSANAPGNAKDGGVIINFD